MHPKTRRVLLVAALLMNRAAFAAGDPCRDAAALLAPPWPEEGDEVPDALASPLWEAVSRCAGSWIAKHPAAREDELVASIEALGDDLVASAARLTPADTVALAIARGCAGTVVVIENGRPVWSIQELARRHGGSRDELSSWAHESPAFHDGPLVGRVLPLPPARNGAPRFLVDAIAHSAMGLSVPAQLSVWEWHGGAATPVFMQGYGAHLESHEVRLDGDLLRVTTREEPKTFFTCGSCEEPRGTWTLRVTPDGIEDLGTEWESAELRFVDELVAAAACGGVEAPAAPDVRDVLAHAVEGPSCPRLGMLMGWTVTERAGVRVLVVELDELSLTIALAGDRDHPYATGIDVAEPDGCPEDERGSDGPDVQTARCGEPAAISSSS